MKSCVFLLLLLAAVVLVQSRLHRPGDARRRGSEQPGVNSVWLLSKNYSQYVFSAPHNVFMGLTEDGLTVDALDLTTKRITHTYPLPLPGYRMAIGLTGTYVTVVHNSYITFITVGSTKATTLDFPYADTPLSGLVADLSNEHESCGWIHTYNSGSYESKIICVNPTSGNVSSCYDQGGTYGYTSSSLGTPDHDMIYGLTSNGYIVKYLVTNVTPAPTVPRCPQYQYYRRPNWGSYNYPTSAWFSYDHSRIFLNNGLTLTSSSEQATDLEEHGSFNGSFAQQYLYWVAQDNQSPYNVVALRRTYVSPPGRYELVATTYKWPYLEGVSDIEIPVPTTPEGLSVSSTIGAQIYYNPVKNTELIALVNYTNGDYNNYTPGIAFITL